jgi:hypothetical protein
MTIEIIQPPAPEPAMLTTTLPDVDVPGYKQNQSLDVSTWKLEFSGTTCTATWSIAPTPDDSGVMPKQIDAGSIVISEVPKYVKDAHKKFFTESLPALMQNYLNRNAPKAT